MLGGGDLISRSVSFSNLLIRNALAQAVSEELNLDVEDSDIPAVPVEEAAEPAAAANPAAPAPAAATPPAEEPKKWVVVYEQFQNRIIKKDGEIIETIQEKKILMETLTGSDEATRTAHLKKIGNSDGHILWQGEWEKETSYTIAYKFKDNGANVINVKAVSSIEDLQKLVTEIQSNKGSVQWQGEWKKKKGKKGSHQLVISELTKKENGEEKRKFKKETAADEASLQAILRRIQDSHGIVLWQGQVGKTAEEVEEIQPPHLSGPISGSIGNYDNHFLGLLYVRANYRLPISSKRDEYQVAYEIGKEKHKISAPDQESLARFLEAIRLTDGTVTSIVDKQKALTGVDVGGGILWLNLSSGPQLQPLPRMFSESHSVEGGGLAKAQYYGFAKPFFDKDWGMFSNGSAEIDAGMIGTGVFKDSAGNPIGAAPSTALWGVSLLFKGEIGAGKLVEPVKEKKESDKDFAERLRQYDKNKKANKEKPFQIVPSLLIYRGSTPTGHDPSKDLKLADEEKRQPITGAVAGVKVTGPISEAVTFEVPINVEISSTDPSPEELKKKSSKGSEGKSVKAELTLSWKALEALTLELGGNITYTNKGPKDREEDTPFQVYLATLALKDLPLGFSTTVFYQRTSLTDPSVTLTTAGNGTTGGNGQAGSLGAPAGNTTSKKVTFEEIPQLLSLTVANDIIKDKILAELNVTRSIISRDPLPDDAVITYSAALTYTF